LQGWVSSFYSALQFYLYIRCCAYLYIQFHSYMYITYRQKNN